MRSFFTKGRGFAALFALAVFGGGGGCTQVQVEETKVEFKNAVCRSDSGGPPSSAGGSMDTYIVQIFELNGSEATTQSDCNTCLSDRSNCFFEKESCVCGDPVDVSPGRLPEMLSGVRISVPANYGSLYCMRILAVQRSSQPEQCECDSNWEAAPRIRLCSASAPYAASFLPIELDVQCSGNRAFSTCLGDLKQAAN